MKRMLPLAFALLTGCVTGPADTSSVASRIDPVPFSGYAQRAGAEVQLVGWSYARSAWEPIRTYTSSSTSVGASPPIYGWGPTSTFTGNRYWILPGAPCSSGGMGRFYLRERTSTGWNRLKTFTPAGLSCLNAQLLAGADPVAAGNACYTGDTLVLFAPDACVTAPATDATAPSLAVLRATDDDRTWERVGNVVPIAAVPLAPGATLRLRADGVDRDGLEVIQIDYEAAVSCRSGATTAVVHVPSRTFDQGAVSAGGRVVATRSTGVELTAAGFTGYCTGGSSLQRVEIRAGATAYSRAAAGTTVGTLWFALTP